MTNFTNAQEPAEFEDGRDIALAELKKVLAGGPQRPSSLAKHARGAIITDASVRQMALTTADIDRHSNSDAATEAMKKAHARGPEPFKPDTIGDSPLLIERNRDPTVEAVRKAHARPRGFGPSTERQIDANEINRLLQHSRQLRKLGLPPQSDNATCDDRTADDGANRTFSDQSAPQVKPTQFGSRHSQSIYAGRLPAQDTDSDPTVAAIKAIFRAGPQRL